MSGGPVGGENARLRSIYFEIISAFFFFRIAASRWLLLLRSFHIVLNALYLPK